MASNTAARSCLGCKERKVRCDRQQPCSGCARFGRECRFPQSPIRRRRKRAMRDATGRGEGDAGTGREGNGGRDELAEPRQTQAPSGTNTPVSGTPRTSTSARLVVGEGGRSRLLAGNAWANIKDEGESDVSRALLKDGDEEQDEREEEHGHPWTPSPAQLEVCWRVYVDNVDPVVRVLHKPTTRQLVEEAQRRWRPEQQLEAGPRALLLAVCLAALRSLEGERRAVLFGEGSGDIMARCRRAAESALTQARLVRTHSLQVVQAFVLYLVSVRQDSGSAWALVGLALRIAMALGVHRDGGDFGLPAVETELRRRLWWELRLLDVRTSEDCGAAPSVFANANTRLPRDVGDGDVDSRVSQSLSPTEMSYSLLRFELCAAVTELNCPLSATATPLADMSFRQREAAVAELSASIRRKYPFFFDGSANTPFFRFASDTSSLVLLKLRLQVHFQEGGERTNRREDTRQLLDELLDTSTTLLETSVRLARDEDMAPWCWLMQYYTQWHAVSFVFCQVARQLDSLSSSPVPLARLPEPLQRAWAAVEAVFEERRGRSAGGPWGLLESRRQRIRSRLDLDGDVASQTGWSPGEDWSLGWNTDPEWALGTQISFGPGEDLSFLWDPDVGGA